MWNHDCRLVLIFPIISCFFVAVFGDCHLKKTDDHSTNLLKKIQPLNGASFKYTYTDETVKDNYKYYLSICDSVKIDGYDGLGVGVVQEDLTENPGRRFTEVGLINSTMIKGGTDWIMLSYTEGKPYGSHCKKSGDGKRQAHIMIVCDPYDTKGTFKVLYEHNSEDIASDCFYLMELTSSVVCSSQPSGLSSGSIFLIIFFTVAGSYLLIGMLYKRCVYGAKGIDQIPNSGFWKTCGSLQAEGCTYMCKCTESGYKTNMPYEGVADDQLDDPNDDEHLLPM